MLAFNNLTMPLWGAPKGLLRAEENSYLQTYLDYKNALPVDRLLEYKSLEVMAMMQGMRVRYAPRDRDNKLVTAKHEAAHALVAAYLGERVKKVWIKSDPDGENWNGAMVVEGLFYSDPQDQGFKMATIIAAGNIGEHARPVLHMRDPERIQSAWVSFWIDDALGQVYGTTLIRIHATVRVILDRNKAMFQAIVDDLLAHGKARDATLNKLNKMIK